MTSYDYGDVVDVYFPFIFIESPQTKRRPALVLSSADFQSRSGACVLVMLTSAERSRWDDDLLVENWQRAGLRKPTVLRWKLFTLDESLIVARRGSLSEIDRAQVKVALKRLFSAWQM